MVIIKCDFCGKCQNVDRNYSTFVGVQDDGWIEFKRTGSVITEHACPDCAEKIGVSDGL